MQEWENFQFDVNFSHSIIDCSKRIAFICWSNLDGFTDPTETYLTLQLPVPAHCLWCPDTASAGQGE